MEYSWIKENILKIVYNNTFDMLKAVYRLSHYHEYPEWREKVYSVEDLDNYYRETKGDANWWKKQWGGANLRDIDLQPFIDGKYGELTEEEQQIVDLVKDKEKPYGLVVIAKSTIHVLQHEIAHNLYYLIPEYKNKVNEIVENYSEELQEVKDKLKEFYDEENIIDELHAYCGVYFHYYLFPLGKHVPKQMRKDLVNLYRKFLKRKI